MRIKYYPQPSRRNPRPAMRAHKVTGAEMGCFTVILIVFAALLATCVGAVVSIGPPPPPRTSPSPSPPTTGQPPGAGAPAPAPPRASSTKACNIPATIYDGVNCVNGGEPVTVSHVVDGDTFDLADGRRIRLLGVDTPEAGECGFDEATKHTRSLVGSKQVRLYREPGVTDDRNGRELAYVDVGSSSYVDDLGHRLALWGHAELSSASDANAAYNEKIRSAAEGATGPCETPPTTTPPTPQDSHFVPVPDNDDDGENWYCRRRRWC